MKKAHISGVPEVERQSPSGKFHSYRKDVSGALGRDEPALLRHPFDLMQVRIPAGAKLCPYHMHSAQWEMYVVLSGRAIFRDEGGEHEAGPGDTVLYPPGEAHQISNPGPEELSYYVIADNPLGESCYYPDSGKRLIFMPQMERVVLRGTEVDYFDGED